MTIAQNVESLYKKSNISRLPELGKIDTEISERVF